MFYKGGAFVIAFTHDLVWEIISVPEKRKNNCIVKIIDNV